MHVAPAQEHGEGAATHGQVLKNKEITLISSLIFLGHPNFVAECLQSIKPAELKAANKIIKPNRPSKNKLVNNCILMVQTASLRYQVHFVTGMLHASCGVHLFPVRSAHGFVAHSCRLRQMQLSWYNLKGNWEKPNHWQAECACSCWCTISEAVSNLVFLLS